VRKRCASPAVNLPVRCEDGCRRADRPNRFGRLKRVSANAVPPGWPDGVPPPDGEDFVGDAVAWLLDAAPSHYRIDSFLRGQPIMLVRMVCERLQADLDAARRGWLPLSQWTAAGLPEEARQATLEMLQREGPVMTARLRAATHLRDALTHGTRWVPRL